MEDDFVVPVSKQHLVEHRRVHISKLFNVDVEIIPSREIHFSAHGAQTWVRLISKAGLSQRQQDVQNAKEYILSLVSDDDPEESQSINCSRNDFEKLQISVDEIEKQSRAVISFQEDTFTVHVHGCPINRGLATSYIDHLLKSKVSVKEPYVQRQLCQQNEAGCSFKSRGQMVPRTVKEVFSPTCLSPGADSCYGSSDDNVVETTSTLVSGCLPSYRGYGVESSALSPQSDHSSSTSSDAELDLIQNDPRYVPKVEFGVKLGYSEDQVRSVLCKLGIDAPQNKLLSELISLGSAKTSAVVGGMQSLESNDCDVEISFGTMNLSGGLDSCEGMKSGESEETTGYLEGEPDQNYVTQSSSDTDKRCTEFRHIVIDGSNVAMSHGNKEVFSCQGIKLAVDWFKNKGCTDITVFVPQWRKECSRPDTPIQDQHILTNLERERILTFTPARRIGGRRIVCYDDRFILRLASETDGIVVSNDNYRDLVGESREFKKVVEERQLMYSFVRDKFMPPDDPLGRYGPSLENFLRKEPTVPEPAPPPCPYGKKCTYGNKCKYFHPERGNTPQKSVTEKLAEQAKQQMQEMKDRSKATDERKKVKKQKPSEKRVLTRTDSSSVAALSSSPTPPPRPPRQPLKETLGTTSQRDILEVGSSNENADFKAYNEKLAQYRRNIEMQQRITLPVPEPPVDVTWSRTEPGQARASPVREQLVTGHLAVAQTLSDEATRKQHQDSISRAHQVVKEQEELKQALKQDPRLLGIAPDEDTFSGPAQGEDYIHAGLSHNYPSPLTSFPGAMPNRDQGLRYGEYFLSDRSGGVSTARSVGSSATPVGNPRMLTNMTRQNSTSDPTLNKPFVRVDSDFSSDHTSSRQPYRQYHDVFPQRPAMTHSPFTPPLMVSGQYGSYSNPLPLSPNQPVEFPQQYSGYSVSRPSPAPRQLDAGMMAAPVWTPTPLYVSEDNHSIDRPIEPTEERYSLYYHLCGLFPEQHVRRVMNQHPFERNPRTLCMYIMNFAG